MSEEALHELISAAIDGELTPSQHKLLRRLLKSSPRVRALYLSYQKTAQRMRQLPAKPSPFHFTEGVMEAIAARGLQPTPLPPVKVSNRWVDKSAARRLGQFSIATSVMVFMSLGFYLFFANRNDSELAQFSPSIEAVSIPSANVQNPPRERDDDHSPDLIPVNSGINDRELPTIPQVAVRTTVPELGPEPRVQPDPILAPPVRDIPEIRPVDLDKIRVSKFYGMVELAADTDKQQQLAKDLLDDELIRLDLFCESTQDGLERMQQVAQKLKWKLAIDDVTANRLKAQPNDVELMLFTEALNPQQVCDFIVALSQPNTKKGSTSSMPYDTLVVAPFMPQDLQRLTRLLGIPNPLIQRPAPQTTPKTDIRRPLPQGTADLLAKNLAKYSNAKSEPNGNTIGVVVSYAGIHVLPSNAVQQYLSSRATHSKRNTKPLMLVLRTLK
ncbi:MAG: hypothetical protein R3B84_13200 [Zavarzinella sp.]